MLPTTTSADVDKYLRPDYLAPLPAMLDCKKSPLALLAQTCSQIGSDSSTSLSIFTLKEKSSQSCVKHAQEKSSPLSCSSNSVSSSTPKESFAPCYTNDRKSRTPSKEAIRKNNDATNRSIDIPVKVPNQEPRSTPYPRGNSFNNSKSHGMKTNGAKKNPSSLKTSSSPTIKSMFTSSACVPSEKLFCKGTRSPKAEQLGSNKIGMSVQIADNSAIRSENSSPRVRADAQSHNAAIIAANAIYNPFFNLSVGSIYDPYSSYGHNKHLLGDLANRESTMYMYRDPYCVGCHLGSHLHPSPVGGNGGDSFVSNCNQCDHHKAVMAAAVSNLRNQFTASALLSQAFPFVCNWVSGETHCGRRFSTSEELFQHLTSHMNILPTPASETVESTPSSFRTSSIHPLLSPSPSLMPQTPLQLRSYPTPPLSPPSSRFHPYSKSQAPSVHQAGNPQCPLTPFLPLPSYLYMPTIGSNPSSHLQ